VTVIESLIVTLTRSDVGDLHRGDGRANGQAQRRGIRQIRGTEIPHAGANPSPAGTLLVAMIESPLLTPAVPAAGRSNRL
jgi:hypothetical protein